VVGIRCMTWECGWLGKVPCVQNGNVDSLERFLEYGLGWSIPNVRNGIVDGLERYLMYEIGMWIVWKGA
jgi:hypothetical protein